jgi:hypothetical protein
MAEKGPKESNVLTRKMEQASTRMAKALRNAAVIQEQLAQLRAKGKEKIESNYNSAEGFQQKLNALDEKKAPTNFKTMKNFIKQRKTIVETANPKVCESVIEEILKEHKDPSEEYYFEDEEFGVLVTEFGPTLAQEHTDLEWPFMDDIADFGDAQFMENRGDLEILQKSFWIKRFIQGELDNLEFLK